MRFRWLVVGTVVGLLVTGASMFFVLHYGSAQANDLCARNEAQTPVLAEFDMPNGAAFWQHFPNAGKAPILAAQPGPMHVIVFVGAHHAIPLFGPPGIGSNSAPTNVVCVVGPDGDTTYYSSVPFEGMVP